MGLKHGTRPTKSTEPDRPRAIRVPDSAKVSGFAARIGRTMHLAKTLNNTSSGVRRLFRPRLFLDSSSFHSTLDDDMSKGARDFSL